MSKHPYDEYIRAFLDGKKVEVYKDTLKRWLPIENLVAFVCIEQEFRIVPEDFIIEQKVSLRSYTDKSKFIALDLPDAAGPNVRFVFDGMTKKLKSIEMIN